MAKSSHRLTVRLDSEQLENLRSFARGRGVALAPAVRLLVAEAAGRPTVAPATLATLVAAEQAVLMVALVLPDGQRRLREAGLMAVDAAQARLDLFGQEAL